MDADCEALDLYEFNPMTMLRPDCTVLVVGQRGSGKTVFMLYLLQCLARQLDLCLAFVPTRDTREEYEKRLQRCFVYPSYDKRELERICQSQIVLSNRKAERMSDGSLNIPRLRRVGVVLDDCMFDKSEFNCAAMKYLLMNGRHDNFFFMNGVQYIMSFPKDLRSQIDLAIVFPEPNIEYREPLRKNLLGVFKSDEQLVRTFEEGIHAHEALVFDQRAFRAKKPCLFYCKAPHPIAHFRVGSDLFWGMYYRHYVKPSYEHIEAQIDNALSLAKTGAGTATEGAISSGKKIVRGKEVLPIQRHAKQPSTEVSLNAFPTQPLPPPLPGTVAPRPRAKRRKQKNQPMVMAAPVALPF